jgi:Uma2 family endonuclease
MLAPTYSPSLIEERMTQAAFEAFCDLPENQNRRFELIEGVPVEMSAPLLTHSFTVARLIAFLHIFLMEHDLGFALGENCDFELDEENTFKPDVVFISYARQPELPEKRFTQAPELMVEVMSPSNSDREILTKIEIFMHYGTLLAWVVYPETRSVRVYTPNPDGSLTYFRLGPEDKLSGGNILPGLEIPIAELFPKKRETAGS